MRYEEWAATVPESLRTDPLWRREDYRLALYIADEGWDDVRRLSDVRASSLLSERLSRSLGSISANIAEGYARASGDDRARYYEYALGSARESRDWYHKASRTLGPELVRRRLRVLTSIVRLLTYSIPHERGTSFKEVAPRANAIKPAAKEVGPGAVAAPHAAAHPDVRDTPHSSVIEPGRPARESDRRRFAH